MTSSMGAHHLEMEYDVLETKRTNFVHNKAELTHSTQQKLVTKNSHHHVIVVQFHQLLKKYLVSNAKHSASPNVICCFSTLLAKHCRSTGTCPWEGHKHSHGQLCRSWQVTTADSDKFSPTTA